MQNHNAELLSDLAGAFEDSSRQLAPLSTAYETAAESAREIAAIEGCGDDEAEDLCRRLLAASELCQRFRQAMLSVSAQMQTFGDRIEQGRDNETA